MATLAKKLQIKPGMKVLLVGAPDELRAVLEGDAPEGVTFVGKGRGPFEAVLLFVEDAATLERRVPAALAAVEADGALWIAYPKRSSGVSTDITRDRGWSVLDAAGWGGVAQVSLDATWSALRFKPEAAVKRRASPPTKAAARAAGAGATADAAPKAPDDLTRALRRSAAARKTWASLAPSHVREYVSWLEGAKREDTRTRRVEQAIALLEAGVRDRNAKYRG